MAVQILTFANVTAVGEVVNMGRDFVVAESSNLFYMNVEISGKLVGGLCKQDECRRTECALGWLSPGCVNPSVRF